MLKWAQVFLVLAGVAALFGFGGIAEGLADIAKVPFVIFGVVMLVFVVLGVMTSKAVT